RCGELMHNGNANELYIDRDQSLVHSATSLRHAGGPPAIGRVPPAISSPPATRLSRSLSVSYGTPARSGGAGVASAFLTRAMAIDPLTPSVRRPSRLPARLAVAGMAGLVRLLRPDPAA